MDGLLDWYLLGVIAGLAVAAAVGVRRHALSTLAGGAALAAAVVIVVLALPWWALGLLAGGGLVGWYSFRHLSLAALPAAFLGVTVLALVPAVGYILPVLAPLAGARLGRRAESRYAGLRILARD